MASEAEIRAKYEALNPVMDERMSRLWAAAEADAIGGGGIAEVERATGLARTTIRMGSYELAGGVSPDDVVNVRRAGGGRPRIEETRPEILGALEALVDPVTRGDPESPLRWTSKSTRKLANELRDGGYTISPQKVGQLLHAQGYSLQGTYKTLEGSSHPDRNEQFEFINARVDAAHVRGAPVISVDTKKKELVGDFKNAGREWQPEGRPVPVRVHDFIDKELGKASRMGSTTSDRTPHGSASVWITIRPNSPSSRSRAGGATWARRSTRMPPSYSSQPTVVAPTATARVASRPISRTSQIAAA